MLAIVSYHFAYHGGFKYDTQIITLPRLWYLFLEMGGSFGVNVFVLISGYFLSNDKNGCIDSHRVLKFWGQVCFYSVTIFVISCGLGICKLSPVSIVKTIFPITWEKWWFASTYFVMYLMHPFVNRLLRQLDKRDFQKLLLFLVGIWCLIPTFTFQLEKFQSNYFLWFLTLYIIAAYVRSYDLNPKFTYKHYLFFFLLFSSLRYLSCIALAMIGVKIQIAGEYRLVFYNMQSVLTLVSSLSVVMVFKNTKVGYNRWINLVASATFGIYLIHDSELIRTVLWNDLFKSSSLQGTVLLIPYSIVVTILVYMVCTLIELFRQRNAEKWYLPILCRCYDCLVEKGTLIIGETKEIVFGKS